MLMMKERRPAFRTIEGWARSVLLEAGAIRECEEHGWMADRADPHARERALVAARRDPPSDASAEKAVVVEMRSLWPFMQPSPKNWPGSAAIRRPQPGFCFIESLRPSDRGGFDRSGLKMSCPQPAPSSNGGMSCSGE
jgi:hypothetical protein